MVLTCEAVWVLMVVQSMVAFGFAVFACFAVGSIGKMDPSKECRHPSPASAPAVCDESPW